MTYGLWLSAGGLQVNEYRQSVAANNLANVDTVGFKRDFALIHERRVESETNAAGRPFSNDLLNALSGGPWVRPTVTGFEQGELVETGGTLDAALVGEGFFSVSDGKETRYTRDGRFVRDAAGQLAMAAGDGRFKVLGSNGRPITLADPSAGTPSIGRDGTIRQGETVVGQIALTRFEDPSGLRKVGKNVFANVGQAQARPATAEVVNGFVERSTVDPIDGLTKMIEVSRAYELNGRMISLQDETLGQVVSRVGRFMT